MIYEFLTLGRDGPVATVMLNRPEKRNALSRALRAEIARVFGELAGDDSVSVVILTGAGSVFCAGFDLSEFDQSGDVAAHFTEDDNPVVFHTALGTFDKPIVGAINGPALAGGFDIACQCDVRIAAETAVFGHPEIKFGAPTMFTQLSYIVGGGVARELALSGRRIDAAEALRIGLVSSVVPAADLPAAAMECARSIAEAPLAALRVVKATINARAPLQFP
ncbi:MAG: enoyl-CoA hydratase/isomerase family protein [Actinomycetota bacterium]